MKLWSELISTDYGLMSLAVIATVIAMGLYFTALFVRKSRRPAPKPPQPRAASDSGH